MVNRFVSKLEGLAELTASDVAALRSATSRPRRYVARQDLIREGDEPGPMFVMLEGWACRYKILPSGSRQIMAFLMPGDACDLHIKLLAEMDHSIQTITPAMVATVTRAEMQTMMHDHPSIAKAMYSAQLIDEGIMRAWIVSMGRRSSTERVAHLMCELYLRARSIDLTGDGEFVLPLSQLVLADALGMTAVHINRVFRTAIDGGDGAQTRQRHHPGPSEAHPYRRVRRELPASTITEGGLANATASSVIGQPASRWERASQTTSKFLPQHKSMFIRNRPLGSMA